MSYCASFANEQYYRRLLLTVVGGPSSYNNLQIINGVLQSKFQAGCIVRRLLEDNKEWIQCFEEASLFASEDSAHTFFVTTLTNGVGLANSTPIWNQFTEKFYNDLPQQLQTKTDILEDLINPHLDHGLYLLAEMLEDVGKTLQMCGFPILQHNWHPLNTFISRELAYNTWMKQYKKLKS